MHTKVNLIFFRKRLLLLIFLFPLATLAQNGKGKFTVNVKIDSMKPGDTVYLSYSNPKKEDEGMITDSLIFKADKLTFTGELTEPAEAIIYRYTIEKVDTAREMKMFEMMPFPEDEKKELMEYFLNPRKMDQVDFLLVPGETTIKSPRTLAKAAKEGPEALIAYGKLNKDFERLNNEMSSTLDIVSGGFSMPDDATQKQMYKAFDSIRRIANESTFLKYVSENPESLVSLFALRKGLPHQIDSADKYLSFLNHLSPSIQEWNAAKKLREMLEAARKTEIGRVVEDFEQMDSTGKKVRFSTFHGKYVLLELWASWCVPCRKKNPGLREIQEKYAGKNFTIIGIALEEKDARKKWRDAIKKDNLSWPQLTDFKDWKNAVAMQFGVRSIPFNLLVDPKGKIIGKNLYEDDLELELKKVLK